MTLQKPITPDVHFKVSRRTVLVSGLGFAGTLLAACNLTPAVKDEPNEPPLLEPLAVSVPSIAGTAAWQARASSEPVTLTGARPDKIVVHHTADPNGSDVSQSRAYALARQIQAYHMDSNGWIDSGQHFTVSRGGFVTEGRHRSLETLQGGTNMVSGAHCPGQNTVGIGIENEGTYQTVQPPAALYNQLVALCAYICQQYNLPADRIYGHRDFINTQCPGDLLYDRIAQLRRDVAARLGSSARTSRVWAISRRGDNNERARTLQYLLRARGYGLTPDGAFGAGTETAVKNFQTTRGLTADGIVGRYTWEALLLNAQTGSSGDAVRAVQSQLSVRGYAVTVDGSFGTGTANAVKAFETTNGLLSDGVVDPDTWAKLVS
jgi:N-acetyl-anhydromuramyl-L-alanine amidase AmpD